MNRKELISLIILDLVVIIFSLTLIVSRYYSFSSFNLVDFFSGCIEGNVYAEDPIQKINKNKL